MLKENNCQPKILYSVKISLKSENIIKALSGKQKLREFITSIFSLKETLKGIFQAENK